MSGFAYRLKRGEEWAAEVVRFIEEQGWKTVPLGAENVAPEAHRLLSFMKNPDPTARFLRYMPDGFAVKEEGEEAFFFDAKSGPTIEKNAYLAYQAFAGNDRRVFVFIRNGDDTYCVPIRKLKFLDSWDCVRSFPPDRQMPVDEDGWIAPRLWPEAKYLAWKRRNPHASGTPFRYFDLGAMSKYKMGAEHRETAPVGGFLA